MLALGLDILSWLLIIAGSVFAIIGGIGMHRMPDFYARSHAASITDTGGAGPIIVGLLLQSPDWIVAIKLLMILLFLWFTGPTAVHILAQAALGDGLKPQARKLGPVNAYSTVSPEAVKSQRKERGV